MTPPLNQEQQDVLDSLFSFILSPSSKEMTISGPAGSGKTFLLQKLISDVMHKYYVACKSLGIEPIIQKTVFTATTNKAAEVLVGSFSKYNVVPTTIHSFMNLRVEEDYEKGIQKVIPSPNFHVHTNTLIIIDEASMVDWKLYKYIMEGTDNTCKIIYVGDHCQLAPVGERVSQVFSKPDINKQYLKTIIRNANQPALMALCAQLRHSVETLTFTQITPVPGVIDVLSGSDFQKEVDNVFLNIDHDSKILAYSNNQVIGYNAYIRKLRNFPDKFTKGELVVNNTAFEYSKRNIIPAEKELTIVDIGGDHPYEYDDHKIDTYSVIVLFNNIHVNVLQPYNMEHVKQWLKHYASRREWKKYFHIKNKFPDLRSRDASTVYKSQGSTYRTTYIDLYNMGMSNIRDQFARMLYVAASRPTDRVIFYGLIPDKFL